MAEPSEGLGSLYQHQPCCYCRGVPPTSQGGQKDIDVGKRSRWWVLKCPCSHKCGCVAKFLNSDYVTMGVL